MANLSDYIVNFTSLDTLNSVTGRGATTTNDITIGNLTSTGIDDNATSTAITIDADENVGIGTTSPVSLGAGYKNLDIRHTTGGGVTLGDASNIHAYLFSDNNGVTLQSPGSRSIKFTTVATERMRIDSAGNVGIGTAAPDSKLQITTGTNNIIQHRDATHSTLTNVTSAITFSRTDGIDDLSAIMGWNDGGIALSGREGIAFATGGGVGYSSTVERMRIDSSGNTVAKPSGGEVTLGANGHLTSKQSLDVATAGGRYIGASNRGIVGQIRIEQTTTSADGGYVSFDTCASGSTSPTERMRINSSGDVGIGVVPDSFNTVDGALQVGTRNTITSFSNDIGIGYNHYYNSGWKYANTDVAARFSSNSGVPFLWQYAASGSADGAITWSEAMRIDSSGKVGINSSAPSYRFEVAGTNEGVLGHLKATDSTQAYMMFSNSTTGSGKFADGIIVGLDSDESAVFWNFEATPTRFGTSGTERMRIDSSGNVGIGTTSIPAWNGNIGRKFAVTGPSSNTNAIISLQSGATGVNNGAIYEAYSTNTTSGSVALGSIAFLRENTSTTALSSYTAFYTNNAGAVLEKARIDSAGNLLVGTTTAEARLTVKSSGSSSTTNAINVDDVNGTELFYVRDDGAFRTGSGAVSPYNNTAAVTANVFVNTDGTLIRATSSRRYKKDIVDARFGLSDVLNLRPVNYKGNNIEVDGDTLYGGLIAEEVHDAGLTEFVEYNDENQPDALRYQHMVSLCIKAIQEQQAMIEELKAEVAALKGE